MGSLRVCMMLGEADDAVWRWVGVLSQWDHGLVYTCVSVAVLVYVTAIKVEVCVGQGCLFHPTTSHISPTYLSHTVALVQ